MQEHLIWETDGRDWPNRDASRFVSAGGWTWHVQEMGVGAIVLVVHGTGASTHSWRDVMPLLATDHRVIAVDLPGHGFTRAERGSKADLSLPGMSAALGALLREIGIAPDLAIGHSAGAAVIIRMCLDGEMSPAALISLNGALVPFQGFAAQLFTPLAKMLALNPIIPRLASRLASNRNSVNRLLQDTGSSIDAAGLTFYGRLFANPAHVAGTLGMMANWDLAAIAEDLPKLRTPLFLIAAGADRTIPPDDAFKIRDRVPGARVKYVPNLGHLAHEERPVRFVALVREIEREVAAQHTKPAKR